MRTLCSNDDLFSLQFSKESQFRCLPSKMPACTLRVTSADLSTLRVLDIQHLAVEDLPFCTDNYRQTAKLHQCRCAYGWISRLPTQAVCKKLWAELRLGQQTLKAASPYLRCVLTGGLSHLDCIAGVNLIRIVHFMKHGSQINWQAGRGSPLAVLKQWLKDKGWAIVQPWVWAVQNSFFRLDLGRPGNDYVSHLQHQLRMGWRWFKLWPFP